MRTLDFGFTASAEGIKFVFVMTNPLSKIRGSLKDIKADYARHAGIRLQGGNQFGNEVIEGAKYLRTN